ncbi:HCP-like protein [Delitschia confertaspora ATCC 74209]|uniref:HCP-like protein n=1 Tax=Delitschia confertaspora ATCC 74209 TaxID=1513339 RepID=A0A9P4JSE5_9PLEO|nr:HCP-like protein [Delitschia confertaspora ATCC 74209]
MAYEDAAPAISNKTLPPVPPKDAVSTTPSDSLSSSSRSPRQSIPRKPFPGAQQPAIVLQGPTLFNVRDFEDTVAGGRDSRQSGSSLAPSSTGHSRSASAATSDRLGNRDSGSTVAVTKDIPLHQLNINDVSYNPRHSHTAYIENVYLPPGEESLYTSADGQPMHCAQQPEGLSSEQYSEEHSSLAPSMLPRDALHSPSSDSQQSHPSASDQSSQRYNNFNYGSELRVPPTTVPRPNSAYALGSELNLRGRTHSRHLSVGGSPVSNGSQLNSGRQLSANRRSPENRPTSYIDLLNLPYSQQEAPAPNLDNAQLRHAVGANASLLDRKKTLDMYRANVKKTQDNGAQYEFALLMVQVAQEVMASGGGEIDNHGLDPVDLLREARQILQRLADRSYPFAQYYLGDGYASGLFNKDKPDYDRAFPLFVAASKHGHAESGYRAALCYEFGWGCRKDYAKAVQFYRAAASKNHPGAATRLGKACLTGDMGLANRYREGVKWLKRATENADVQYNSAPFELGQLHENGYGEDIFKDEAYSAQLYTKAAELGNAQAALRLGEAYEHGLLCCPKDAALSVHYYNCAAQADIPEAMMNLCAWYMVGAEPVLEKDENEAYEWAKRAAEHGLPKAEYACGYFTEMGIGCRRDPLEANVWYVKAADHGDERAKARLAIIHAAASGDPNSATTPVTPGKSKIKKGGKEGGGKDENCVVM